MSRLIAFAAMLGLAGCAGLPKQVERNESHAFSDTSATLLGNFIQPQLAKHPGQSGFRPLPDGVDALLARIVLAEAAQRSLDVQYYIWHNDLSGRHFANALLRAADRGVRVRVLLDDLGVSAKDEVLLSLDAHPNIEIRLFNPIASRTFRNVSALWDITRVNRRMHNKAFIADNQVAILGGRNIGNEYFGAADDVAFSDLDVMTVGKGVPEVSKAFDLFWNAQESYPVDVLNGREGDKGELAELRTELAAFLVEQRDSPYLIQARQAYVDLMAEGSKDFDWGAAHLLYDDPSKVSRPPEDKEGHLLPRFAELGIQAQRSLFIVSPYFIPGDSGVAWLKSQVDRGISVTVLTNSLAATDVGAVHAGYQQYRESLLAAGVRLYEMRPHMVERVGKKRIGSSRSSLHAKTFVFDHQAVFIGSLNLDPRSMQLNTEIGVLCDSETLARKLSDGLETNIDKLAWRLERETDSTGGKHIVWLENDQGVTKRYDSEPQVSAWRKFTVWFLGLLPIESQL